MQGKAQLRLEPQLRQLVSDLASSVLARGIKAYAVGGFLRDALLGRACRDIDLAIAADPLLLGRDLADVLGAHCVPLDKERHQVRLVWPGGPVHVDLLPLSGDIQGDLLGRDYTIDAMAGLLEEVASGRVTLVDPCGGRADLRRHLVRAIRGDNLRADPLRVLRGVRLAVELGFRIEPSTAGLIRRYALLLPEAAVERQRDELVRILATPRAGEGLRLMDELHVLEWVLPEVAATRGVEQPKEHHWDVLGHSLETVAALDQLLAEEEPARQPWRDRWQELWRQLAWWSDARSHFRQEVVVGVPRSAVVKLGGLLHDIAKPETKAWDEAGRMRFFGHAEVGAEKASRILHRLRFSAREVEMVRIMIQAHLRPLQMAQQGLPTRRAVYRYFRDCGDVGIDTLFLSLADHLATVGPRFDPVGWRQHVSLVNYLLGKRFQEEAVVAPPRLLRGDELMAELGLPEGPLIGKLLALIREALAAGEVTTREEALELARTALAGERTGTE